MTWVSVTYYGSFLYVPFVSYEKGIVTRYPSDPTKCLSGAGQRSNGAQTCFNHY